VSPVQGRAKVQLLQPKKADKKSKAERWRNQSQVVATKHQMVASCQARIADRFNSNGRAASVQSLGSRKYCTLSLRPGWDWALVPEYNAHCEQSRGPKSFKMTINNEEKTVMSIFNLSAKSYVSLGQVHTNGACLSKAQVNGGTRSFIKAGMREMDDVNGWPVHSCQRLSVRPPDTAHMEFKNGV